MSNESQQNERVVDQFSRQAESYARMVNDNKITGPFDRIAFLDPAPADRVLDVACGTGRFVLSLAGRVKHVTGIDLTPAMIEQARAARAGTSLTNIEWKIGDVAALPFADGVFTLVVCSAAFHHFANPPAVLSEMRRVCAAGGRVFVMDVTPPPEKSAQFDHIEQLRDPSHAHALTLAELRSAGVAAGLKEIRLHSHRSSYPLEAVLATSFPTVVTVDDVRRLYQEDADSGQDRYGLQTRSVDNQLMLAYPMSAVLWHN